MGGGGGSKSSGSMIRALEMKEQAFRVLMGFVMIAVDFLVGEKLWRSVENRDGDWIRKEIVSLCRRVLGLVFIETMGIVVAMDIGIV